MSNVLKLSGPIKVGNLPSAPSNPQEGFIYFDTTDGVFKFFENGSFRVVSAEEIAEHLTDDSVLKHDADEIDYQRADVNRKNIAADATSPNVELALNNLDDAIGSLNAAPTNYTPSNPAIVADHLSGIDAALGSIDITPNFSDAEFTIHNDIDPSRTVVFDVSAVATATERTITVPNSNVNLGLIATAIQSSEKGANNGVASLDSGGKIPSSQLPNSVVELQGNWNASTNSPTLADGSGNPGDVYEVTVAGTQDLGSGNITFEVGDWVVYGANAVWYRSPNSNAVTSVNGQTGTVVLDTDDVDEGATNLYFTNSRAQTAVVSQNITNGVTNLAPSEDAVFDALAGKLSQVSDDVDPELGGDLDVSGFAIEGAASPVLLAGQNSVRRAKQASKSSFIEEEYIHSIALAASQTNTTISALTFAHATYEGMEITYKVRQATTSNVRIGTVRIVTNGTNVVLNDVYTDSADLGITFSAVVNGANVEVRYSSGSNAATLRADIKRFLT